MSHGSDSRGGSGSGSEMNGLGGATTASAPAAAAAATGASVDGQEENETRSTASSATSGSVSGSAPGAGAGKVTPKPLLVESRRMLNQAELPAHGRVGYKPEYEAGMAMAKDGVLGLALAAASRQDEGYHAEQREADGPVVFHDSPVAQSEAGAYSP